jgi:glycosyltransferase involved in cell wall biosynthesis
MKIVVAAWHVRDFNVGLGRYARELIEGIGRVDREHDYLVLVPPAACVFTARPNMIYRTVRIPFFRRRVWEQVAPLTAGAYDLLHFPYDSCIAWKRGKFVATIHDVKPLVLAQHRPRPSFNERLFSLVIGDRWTRLDHVVTDSLCSQRDILRLLPFTEDRVTVVYPGVDQQRFAPAARREEGKGAKPYVLCVAGKDPAKNVETLIEAFARLPQPVRQRYHLVLAGDVGKRAGLVDLVNRLGLTDRVLFPGPVSDDRLLHLYRQARLFVFPSRYEGFGLPVLEAMACGCPVISSNASSLPEVVGDAGVLVEPDDVEGLSREMLSLLSDEGRWEELRKRGLVRAKQFSWDETARRMVEVYRKVAAQA